MNKKVTRTFSRTKETMDKYMAFSEERRIKGDITNPFLNWQHSLVKEFTNWVVVTNDFPYDAIANINHMIATKREVPFDWKLLNEEEKNEFEAIRDTYIKENYDVIWENLPRGITVPGHFHLHLLVLKREEY